VPRRSKPLATWIGHKHRLASALPPRNARQDGEEDCGIRETPRIREYAILIALSSVALYVMLRSRFQLLNCLERAERMSIAIVVHVNDGAVLAADSASTFSIGPPEDGRTVVQNVYENACKVFNLRKGYPIGAVTWGVGCIGHSSVATLVKDYRAALEERADRNELAEELSVKDLAEDFRQFMSARYVEEFKNWPETKRPSLGFVVVGYSHQKGLPESWSMVFKGERSHKLNEVTRIGGLFCAGLTEPIVRMCRGYSEGVVQILKDEKIDEDKISSVLKQCDERLAARIIAPAMPIQDAIDLAVFLAETAKQFWRFNVGPPVVGGLIEVAAITKHEGFKWIRRKHYYPPELNPLL